MFRRGVGAFGIFTINQFINNVKLLLLVIASVWTIEAYTISQQLLLLILNKEDAKSLANLRHEP